MADEGDIYEMFEEFLNSADEEDIVKTLLDIAKEEEFTPANCARLAVTIKDKWRSFDATRPALLLAVLELTCKLATEISVLTAVLSPLIAPFARDILEKGVPKATLWQTFDSWDVSMPSDVELELDVLRNTEHTTGRKRAANEVENLEQSAAKRFKITEKALLVFNSQDEHAQADVPLYTEDDVERAEKGLMRKAANKVMVWLRSGGTQQEVGYVKDLIPAAKELPVSWKVHTSAVVPFMAKLTARITEVLVDHPQLTDRIGEVLAHMTTVTGRIEKAKRLQEFHVILGEVAGGRMSVVRLEEQLGPMLAVSETAQAVAEKRVEEEEVVEEDVVDESAADDDDDEYDPFAVLEDGEDEIPSATDMDPTRLHYLPPYKGHPSSSVTPPQLGPLHLLARTFYLKPKDWTHFQATPHCQTLSVLLVRREEGEKPKR